MPVTSRKPSVASSVAGTCPCKMIKTSLVGSLAGGIVKEEAAVLISETQIFVDHLRGERSRCTGLDAKGNRVDSEPKV